MAHSISIEELKQLPTTAFFDWLAEEDLQLKGSIRVGPTWVYAVRDERARRTTTASCAVRTTTTAGEGADPTEAMWNAIDAALKARG